MKKSSLIGLTMILNLCSCTHQAPYELKSPCVSEEIDIIDNNNPCIRKPINRYIV